MQTLAGPARFEQVIRHSRFVAHAGRVRSQAESLDFYESVADLQATHNCWAWRIDHQYRFNDDGEPSSSAGRPILAAIEGRELEQVMIVVTRYYGGIKLGVGGLIRAYGGSAAKCLDGAEIIEVSPQADYRLQADFSMAASLHQLMDRFEARKLAEHYGDGGLAIDLRLPETRQGEFNRALAELSRGQARLERIRRSGGD